MDNELKTLTELIAQDYTRWQNMCLQEGADTYSVEFMKKQNKKFAESIRIEKGSKYTKIIKDTSVWGFVVNTDKHPKFKRGDILRAATWRAPATNKARGNILTGDFSWVKWTGPKYL